MLSWDSIELGFERFLELLRENESAWSELERSRAEFFTDALAARALGGERRHLEWYLLERPSAALGGVPVQVWQDVWREGLSESPGDLAAAFLHTVPGAFEVTSSVPGEVLWVRDLFTLGEHPVLELRASPELAVGDLLVGRLFPAGGGAYLLSPAVASFRSAGLLEAVHRDMEEMRSARRGVVRIQQLELERLFHSAVVMGRESVMPQETRERARLALQGLGLERVAVDRALASVRLSARTGESTAITEILDELAFETRVDVGSARLILAGLWENERALVPLVPTVAEDEAARDARTALEAFDRGRREGQDLEPLFQALEHDLGVVSDEDRSEDETAGAPDFPGVVGAMVEEFLWEVGREQGEERASGWAILRQLGDYGRDIGVFDELGTVQLLDFSARWVLDESDIHVREQVETLFDALAAFCRWCEERHGLPLWTRFGPTLADLQASVPRLLLLRQHALAGPGTGAYEIVRVTPGSALVRDDQGRELTVPMSPAQEAHLRDGDVVRLSQRAGSTVLGAGYPREIATLLRGTIRPQRSRGSAPRSAVRRSRTLPPD